MQVSAVIRKIATEPSPSPRLSTTLWQLDWSKHFPKALPETGISVEYASYDESLGFIQANFKEIYGGISNGRFVERFDAEAKARFYRAAGDFFLFRDVATQELVGVGVCNPADWSTYYFRNIAVLPAVQGRGIYQAFFAYLKEVLRDYGVQRIDGHIAPTNLPHIHAITKIGGYATGTEMSERWGAMLHFVVFVDDQTRETFDAHFCEIVRKLR